MDTDIPVNETRNERMKMRHIRAEIRGNRMVSPVVNASVLLPANFRWTAKLAIAPLKVGHLKAKKPFH